ncbi:tyrosine-protein phosphatase [Mumia sp. zg.B53]|uniref:tyrosine-protein phosphatase n=1 Tax=unclassified Mumia TaxID=2621872 RepID=UPI001C6EAFFB|nr:MULTISPECIES: tyrosine-protein phosphatase [unclassified Mumia]MBW9215383.1 tyrosine-protein phosphatase [Mumia sp. zg.B53]MDD9350132.1 tyrosine-protein phosphatase [Mumia sp.]
MSEATTTPNLRDLGGLPTEDGATTVHGVLLRSAMPSIDDRDPGGLPWPPSLVLDLRSSAESGPEHPLAPTGATVRQISLLEALRPDGPQSASPQVVARMATGGLEALYLGMLEVARAELVQVATLVADHDGATLLHCAAGKDRTGVAVAMLLRTAGVSRDAVVKDYLATGAAMDAVLQRLRIAPQIDPSRRAPSSYLAIPQDAIDAVLDVWDAHPGGTAGWLYDAGAAARVVDGLRTRLVG